MIIGAFVLLAVLAIIAYLVNKVIYVEKFPLRMINVFLGIVALMTILQLFGVGR